MTTYRIESSEGVEMGTYEGATREEAIAAMWRDAGYKTPEAAARALGKSVEAAMDELTVEEVGGQFSGVPSGGWAAKFQGRTLGYFRTQAEAEAAVDAAREESEEA